MSLGLPAWAFASGSEVLLPTEPTGWLQTPVQTPEISRELGRVCVFPVFVILFAEEHPGSLRPN